MDKAKTNRALIHNIIAISIMVLFAILPPFATLTRFGMVTIGLFIAILFAWTVNLPPWISAVGILIASVLKSESLGAVWGAVIGNSLQWTIMLMFVFVHALSKTNLVRYLGLKMLSLKVATKGPYALMAVVLFAGAISVAVTQAFVAVMMLVFSLIKQITEELDLPKHNLWTVLTSIAAALVCPLAIIAVPYSVNYAMFYGILQTMGATAIPNVITSSVVVIAITITLIVVFVLITKFLIRPDIDQNVFKKLDLKSKSDTMVFTKQMLIGIGGLLLLALVVVFPAFFPGNAFSAILNQWGILDAILLMFLLLFLFKHEDGSPIFSFVDTMREGLNWQFVWIFSISLYVGGVLLVAPESGFMDWMALLLAPLGGFSPVVMAIVIFLITVIVTQFVNNSVAAIIVFPVGIQLCSSDPLAMTMAGFAIVIGAGVTVALPSTSIAGALLHGDRDLAKSNQIIVWGLIFSAIMAIVCIPLILGLSFLW